MHGNLNSAKPVPMSLDHQASSHLPPDASLESLESSSLLKEAAEAVTAAGGSASGGGKGRGRKKGGGSDGVTVDMNRALSSLSLEGYQAFLRMTYSVVAGATDVDKYAESCRLLLGNRSYVVHMVERLVAQCIKQLISLAGDATFWKFDALRRAQRRASRRDARHQPHAAPILAALPDASSSSSSSFSSTSSSPSPPPQTNHAKDRRDVAQLVRNLYNGRALGGRGVPELYAVQSCLDTSDALASSSSSSSALLSCSLPSILSFSSSSSPAPGVPLRLPPATLGLATSDAGSNLAGVGGAMGLVLAIELLHDIDDGTDNDDDGAESSAPESVAEPHELRKRPNSTTSEEPLAGNCVEVALSPYFICERTNKLPIYL